MTVYDIGPQAGTWFDLPGGGRVQLRTITPEDWREIQKATVTYGPPEYPLLDGKHQRFQPEIVDKDLQLDMIWDRTIIDWEGIQDREGRPIPCTAEWKARLMLMRSAEFRDFYNAKMAVMNEADTAAEAASEKN